MAERGYPVEHALRATSRAPPSRGRWPPTWRCSRCCPTSTSATTTTDPLRVVAVAHIFYPEMTDEIVDRLDTLPGDYDLVVTTADEEQARGDRARRWTAAAATADVRVVASNRGRDISAFFIDCRDVLESGDYDLVVKVHSKRSPQDGPNVGELFKRHLFENLLSSPGYAANVLRLFQQHSSPGHGVPAGLPHRLPDAGPRVVRQQGRAPRSRPSGSGSPCPSTTRPRCRRTAACSSPARRRCARSPRRASPTRTSPTSAGTATARSTHVLERLVSYAVLSTGHHVREVMNAELAAINYSYLEYRAIALGVEAARVPRASRSSASAS